MRLRFLTRVVASAAILALVAATTIAPGPANAHDLATACQYNADTAGSDPGCKAHWANSHMLWHWDADGLINATAHAGHKGSFQRAADRWEDQTNPNSEWEEHYDTVDGDTHVDVIPMSYQTLGRAVAATMTSTFHIPKMTELVLRSDVQEIDCDWNQAGSQSCPWYHGTGTPSASQYDSWGVWQEELGHAQNISHHIPPGHDDSTHDHTMSGHETPGQTGKRQPQAHENEHACRAYEVVHTWVC